MMKALIQNRPKRWYIHTYLVVLLHLILAIISVPGSGSPTLNTQMAEMIHQTTNAATIKKKLAGIKTTLGVWETKSLAASTIEHPN